MITLNRVKHLQRRHKGTALWAEYLAKRTTNVDAEAMATRIYKPAYATGLWRLNHDGFVPEGVTMVTFATTRETKTIPTNIGPIEYRQIPKKAFFGFQKTKGNGALVATPEKAILDFLWLQDIEWDKKEFERWRFQDDWERINRKRLVEYAQKWGEPRLLRAVDRLLAYLDE
jgi:hypothetical protein